MPAVSAFGSSFAGAYFGAMSYEFFKDLSPEPQQVVLWIEIGILLVMVSILLYYWIRDKIYMYRLRKKNDYRR